MYSNERKKVRGQRRNLNALLNNIDRFMPFTNADGSYEHFHVPSGMFIERKKTSNKVKIEFCRKWIAASEKFIMMEHSRIAFCRVVAMICLPNLWSSQIIIFYDEEYYKNFWNRNTPEMKWIPILDESHSFLKRYKIDTPLSENGYYEMIQDEDCCTRNELWFYERK